MKVLKYRLAQPAYDSVQIRVAITDQIHPDCANEVLSKGAVAWWLPDQRTPSMVAGKVPLLDEAQNENKEQCVAPILCAEEWLANEKNSWSWLTHCTRANRGPWPDESFRQFEDRLLLDGPHYAPSPLETLMRILASKRLIATSHLKRSENVSVCFSNVPLDNLLARREYKRHLMRWDWEPYGLCIRRGVLESLGGRACHYGSDEEYAKLARSDQPFFQMRQSISERRPHRWTTEREWRVVGDLRLSKLNANDAIVFVPTVTMARKVAMLSDFPVIHCERLLNPSDVELNCPISSAT